MHVNSETETVRTVTRHLVGDHVELYRTSFHFKSSIDQLVQMLPSWGDGLAVAAREQGLADQKAIRAAMIDPPTLVSRCCHEPLRIDPLNEGVAIAVCSGCLIASDPATDQP